MKFFFLCIIGVILTACDYNHETTIKFKIQLDTIQINHNVDEMYDFETPSVWIDGMVLPMENAEAEAAKQMGFEKKRIAGCFSSPNLVALTKKHNEITDSLLQQKIGKDWKRQHEILSQKIYYADTLAIFITQNHLQVKNKLKDLSLKQFHPFFSVTRTLNSNILLVQAQEFHRKKDIFREIIFFTVAIDIQKHKVISIDTFSTIR